jgi:hypothetical protein
MQMDPRAALDRDLAAEEHIKEIVQVWQLPDAMRPHERLRANWFRIIVRFRGLLTGRHIDAKTFNDLVQEAVDEQGRIYQDAEAALTEAEVGGLEPPARVFETIPEQRVEDEYYPDMSEVRDTSSSELR